MSLNKEHNEFVDDLLATVLKSCISDEAKELVQKTFNVFLEEAESEAMDQTGMGFDPDDECAQDYLQAATIKILDQRIGRILWLACDI